MISCKNQFLSSKMWVLRNNNKKIESQTKWIKHYGDIVEQDELELELGPKRDNELEIIFQDEPIEEQRRKGNVLAKYVRRHHAPE